MAPDIKREISAAPKLYLNRIGQVIPLITEMNGPIAIIDLFALAQIYNSKIVRVLHNWSGISQYHLRSHSAALTAARFVLSFALRLNGRRAYPSHPASLNYTIQQPRTVKRIFPCVTVPPCLLSYTDPPVLRQYPDFQIGGRSRLSCCTKDTQYFHTIRCFGQ